MLIPQYGISGAALATVIATAFAAFLFDLSSKRTRVIFWLKVKAFNPLSAISGRTSWP
jgi:O-antigen/teichoic acid export membrane protein